MYFVYIVRCKDGSLYTGISSNFKQRIKDHFNGRGGRYTKIYKPEKLLFLEIVKTKSDALKREKEIKGWRKEKKENLIKYGSPNLPG